MHFVGTALMHILSASIPLCASDYSSMFRSALAVQRKVLSRNFMPTPYRNMADPRTTLRASRRARTYTDTVRIR